MSNIDDPTAGGEDADEMGGDEEYFPPGEDGEDDEVPDVYDHLTQVARQTDKLLPEVILQEFSEILTPDKETVKLIRESSLRMKDMKQYTDRLHDWITLLHRHDKGKNLSNLTADESNKLDKLSQFFDLDTLEKLVQMKEEVDDMKHYAKEALHVPKQKFNPGEAGHIIKSIWKSSRSINPTEIAISAANLIMNELKYGQIDVNLKKLTTPVLQSALNIRSGREITKDAAVFGVWKGHSTIFDLLPPQLKGAANVKNWINFLWGSASWRRIAGVPDGSPKPFPDKPDQPPAQKPPRTPRTPHQTKIYFISFT